MTAPDRIWAEAWWNGLVHHRQHDAGGTDNDFIETEYTRSDLIPALLAAERRKALEEAVDIVDNVSAEFLAGIRYPDRDEIIRAIRDLMEKEQGE